MSEDKKIGGAKIEISADSSEADKVFQHFMDYGEKLTHLFGSIGQLFDVTIKKAELMGNKVLQTGGKLTQFGTKAGSSVTSLKDKITSINGSLKSVATRSDLFSNQLITGYQKAETGISSLNAVLSQDTKKTFSEMTKTSATYNHSLVESMKLSTREVKGSLVNLKEAFFTLGQQLIKAFKSPITTIKTIPRAVVTMSKQLTGAVASGFSTAKNLAINQLEKIKEAIFQLPSRVKTSMDVVKNTIVTHFNTAALKTAEAINRIAKNLTDLPNKARQSASRLKTTFIESLKILPSKVGSIFKTIGSTVKTTMSTVGTTAVGVKSRFAGAFEAIKGKAKAILPSLKNSFKQNVTQPAKSATLSVSRIATAIGAVKLVSKAFNILKNSISGAVERYDTLNRFPKILKNMGFSAKEAAESTDYLAKNIKGLPTSLEDITATTQRMVGITKDIDVSTKATIALNDAFLASASGTEDVSRGTEQYLQMLSTGKVDITSWTTLQETMGTGLDKVASAFGYTGKAAQQELYKSLQDGTHTFDEFQEKLIAADQGMGGLAESAKVNSVGIMTSWKNISQAVKTGIQQAMVVLHDTLKKVGLPTIEEFLDSLRKTLDGTFAIFNKMIPPVVKIIAGLLYVLKPFAPYLKMISVAFGTFLAVVLTSVGAAKALGLLVTAFDFLGKLMLANPFALIIAAVAGLAFGLYQAYKKSEIFRRVIDKLLTPLKDVAIKVREVARGIRGLFKAKDTSDMTKFSQALRHLLPQALVNMIVASVTAIKKIFLELKEALKEMFSKGNFKPIIAFGKKVMPTLLKFIIGGFPALILSGSSIIDKIAKGMGISTPALLTKLKGVLQSILTTLTHTLPKMIQSGMAMISSLVSGIMTTLPELLSTMITLIGTLLDTVLNQLPQLISMGVELVLNLIDGIVATIPKLLGMALVLIEALLEGFLRAFPSILKAGTSIIGALIKGITKTLPSLLLSALSIILKVAAGLLKNLPQISTAGMQIILALGKGIISTIGALVKMLPQVFEAIKQAFKEVEWSKLGRDLMVAIKNGLKSMLEPVRQITLVILNAIKTAIVEFIVNVVTKFNELKKQVVDKVTEMWSKIKLIFKQAITSLITRLTIWGADVQRTFNKVKKAINDTVASMWQRIKQIFTNSIVAITEKIRHLSEGLKNKFKSIKKSVTETISAMWQAIKTFFARGIDNIIGKVKELAVALKATVTRLKETLTSLVSKLWISIKTIFKTSVSAVVESVVSFYQILKSKFTDIKDRLSTSISSMWRDIKNNFTTTITSIVDKVKELPNKLAKGIRDGAGALKDAMVEMWKGAVKAVEAPVNKVVGAANWILEKFGSDKKISKWSAYAKGTEGHKGGGAVVNDQKGPIYREALQFPTGEVIIPKERNVFIPNMPKQTKVLKASETKKHYPHYKSGVGDWGTSLWEGIKQVGSKVKNITLDIFDYFEHPEKLVDKVLGTFVDYDGMSGLTLDMGKGVVKQSVGAMKEWATSLFNDYGDPDGISDDSMNANGVYNYLVNYAQAASKKFGLKISPGGGYRPGSRDEMGNLDDHSKHLAIDISRPDNNQSAYHKASRWLINKPGVKYIIANNEWAHQNWGKKWVPYPYSQHTDHVHMSGNMPTGKIDSSMHHSAPNNGSDKGTGFNRWKATIAKALRMNKVPATPAYISAWLKQIQTESGGNPRAVGGNDGYVSEGNATGLLQVKPGTFRGNMFSGHGNIMNGLDNALAAIHYAKGKYGLSGMLSVIGHGHGHGYEDGGLITRHQLIEAGEGNKPEMIIPLTKPARALDLMGQVMTYLSAGDHMMSLPKILATTLLQSIPPDLSQERLHPQSLPLRTTANLLATVPDFSEVIRLLTTIQQTIESKELSIYVNKDKVGQAMASTHDQLAGKRVSLKERGLNIE